MATQVRMSHLARREHWTGIALISPWLVGLVVFTAFPLLASMVLSFTHWNFFQPPQWVGLGNYRELLQDPLFIKSLEVTLIYSAIAVPLNLVAGLALSLLLNLKIRGIGLFRTLFYIPSVLSGVAVAMLWLWLFNPQFGLFNYVLSLIGIQGPNWLGSSHWILPTYILINLWGVGGNAILFLGGLQNIPQQLYEAARIDGASAWKQLIRITLPLLTPTLFFLLLLGIIGAFQVFAVAYVINGQGTSGTALGGPNNSALFYMLYLYQQAFVQDNFGYASALAWVGGIISMVLAFFVYRTQNRWVYYEADISTKGDAT